MVFFFNLFICRWRCFSAADFTSADFAATNNSYTFTNIAPLIAQMNKDRNSSDPDWNKVVLLPVKTSVNSSGRVIALDIDLSMASVKLMGGPDNPLGITIIYSSFSDRK